MNRLFLPVIFLSYFFEAVNNKSGLHVLQSGICLLYYFALSTCYNLPKQITMSSCIQIMRGRSYTNNFLLILNKNRLTNAIF